MYRATDAHTAPSKPAGLGEHHNSSRKAVLLTSSSVVGSLVLLFFFVWSVEAERE